MAGFLYLAVVVDVWSRRVVGWAMANHLRAELVLDALNMALGQRRPRDVIHHSDRKVSANRRLIAIQRFCSARLLGLCQRDGQPKLRGQMRNGIGVDFVRRSKAAE